MIVTIFIDTQLLILCKDYLDFNQEEDDIENDDENEFEDNE
jgi:hypothetical protein